MLRVLYYSIIKVPTLPAAQFQRCKSPTPDAKKGVNILGFFWLTNLNCLLSKEFMPDIREWIINDHYDDKRN